MLILDHAPTHYIRSPVGLQQALGGSTTHSAAGMNGAHGTPEQVAANMLSKPKWCWATVSVIVVEGGEHGQRGLDR